MTLYRDLTAAIRAEDPNHLIIYEGTRWSTDWTIFTEVWDPNSMLQFHKYWSPPDRPSIRASSRRGTRLGLPIYMGEGGENNVAWLPPPSSSTRTTRSLELLAVEEARHDHLSEIRPSAGGLGCDPRLR